MSKSRLRLLVLCAYALAGTCAWGATDEAPPSIPPAIPPAMAPAESPPNYHLVGWLNTFVPGGGQLLLGRPGLAAFQATVEVGTFGWGYSLSKRSPLTLDGVPEELPRFSQARRSTLESVDKPLYANILQEFGIKYHMVNVYDAYRTSARRNGVTEGIDQTSTLDLFLEPVNPKNLADPWVWIPLSLIGSFTLADYYLSRGSVERGHPLTPYSNYLFSFHYGLWEPIGSGAPEEMFYRGFLQNELYEVVPSPYFAVPASAAAFAFSHGPGDGRLTAAIAGLYLGFLANRYHGNLGPGITLHFWGGVLLGLETMLLSHDAQRATPPGGLAVQVNF